VSAAALLLLTPAVTAYDLPINDSTLLMTGESLGLNLESHQRADLQNFLQMSEGEKAHILETVHSGADEAVQTQWGFLKNIVNIDRFFSSGKAAKDADASKDAGKDDEKKDDEKKDDEKKDDKKDDEKKDDAKDSAADKDRAAKAKAKADKADESVKKAEEDAKKSKKDLDAKKEALDAAQKKLDEKKAGLAGAKATADDKAEVAKLKAEVADAKKDHKEADKVDAAAEKAHEAEKNKKKIVLIKNYISEKIGKIKTIQADKTKPTAQRQGSIDKIDAKIAEKAAEVDKLIEKLPKADRASVSRVVVKTHKANPSPSAKNWKAKGKDFWKDLLNSDKYFKLSTDKKFAEAQKFYVLSLDKDGKVTQSKSLTEDSMSGALKHFVKHLEE
jgi:chemotaxis protein histidine kinase CheA